MAVTCDGMRVRVVRALQFNGFVLPSGEQGEIVDTRETRAYAKRWRALGEDLIPVRLRGQVRYVERRDLEMVR